jgi:hypothetical protein
MAVSAQNLISAVPGDLFGCRVEKKDFSIHIMGNDAILEIVQDPFQIALPGGYFFKYDLFHILPRPLSNGYMASYIFHFVLKINKFFPEGPQAACVRHGSTRSQAVFPVFC